MNYSRNLVYNNYYYALENAIGNTLTVLTLQFIFNVHGAELKQFMNLNFIPT